MGKGGGGGGGVEVVAEVWLVYSSGYGLHTSMVTECPPTSVINIKFLSFESDTVANPQELCFSVYRTQIKGDLNIFKKRFFLPTLLPHPTSVLRSSQHVAHHEVKSSETHILLHCRTRQSMTDRNSVWLVKGYQDMLWKEKQQRLLPNGQHR